MNDNIKTLPKFFKPILWSYRFSSLDPDAQKNLIIVQAINYGDMDHWKWISRQYGKRTVAKVLAQTPKTAIRKPAAKLAELIFGIKLKNVSRRTH